MADSRKKTIKPADKLTTARKKLVADEGGSEKADESAVKSSCDAVADDRTAAAAASRPKAEAVADQDGYEVVTPPAPISRPQKRMAIGSLMISGVVGVLIAGGVYVTWPRWSPYVANYLPMLEYKPVSEPLLIKLNDRIDALEAEARDRANEQITIAEMEKERVRLRDGVKSLLARLDELEAAVGDVKRMVAATGTGSGNDVTRQSFERISERIAKLEKKGGLVADLSQRVNSIESVGKQDADRAVKIAEDTSQRLNSAVSDMENRLTAYEKKRTSSAASDATSVSTSATILAISQLRESVMSGRSYNKELEAIQAVSSNDDGFRASLLVLEKHAPTGVATLPDLRETFPQTIAAIVAANRQITGGGWFENMTNRLRSFVSVRKIDGTAPEKSVDSIVLRAENKLKAGDLEGAITSLEDLRTVSEPAAMAARAWVSRAKARISAERAVSSLHVYAVSLIAAKKE